MNISHNTKLKEINNVPELERARNSLISGGDFFKGKKAEMTLDELNKAYPTYNQDDIIYGLNALVKNAEENEDYILNVYSKEQIKKDKRLESVKVFYVPPKEKKSNITILLMAGGAYGSVCTMIEALPVATKLSELGYTCFCLNYRIATPKDMIKGLLPIPLDDVAATWHFLNENREKFDIDMNNYAVLGFSAGGHLASMWGTEHLGARYYSIPQPKASILAYPLITMANVPDNAVKKIMCTGMFGVGYSKKDIDCYDVSLHIDKEYPRTYVVRALDDSTVSIKDAEQFKASMDELGIECILENGNSGNHGFGLGSDTPLKGWVERAARTVL